MPKTITQHYINTRAFRPEISENDFNYFYSKMKAKCAESLHFTVRVYSKSVDFPDCVYTDTYYSLVDACGSVHFELMKSIIDYK